MTTVHRDPDGGIVAFTKGAAEVVVGLSIAVDDAMASLDEVRQASEQMAADGLRVIGLAMRRLSALPEELTEDVERDLTLLGLVGIMDPPR